MCEDYSFAKLCIILVTWIIVDTSPLTQTGNDIASERMNCIADAGSSDDAQSSVIEEQNMMTNDKNPTMEQLDTVKRLGMSRKKRNIINFELLPIRAWTAPLNTIKYKFSGEHDAAEQQIIRDAIAHWEQHTCIRWEEIDLQANVSEVHLVFRNGSLNSQFSSQIGRIAGIPGIVMEQVINIGSNYLHTPGFAISLIGHSLGMFRMHMRHDRDTYVTVNYGNIEPSALPFYSKLDSVLLNTFGLPYDYGSIMHNNGKDFLKDSLPNKTTLDATDGYSQMAMGQKAILSFFDAKTVNFAYCSEVCTVPLYCARSGYQDPNNCTRCRCIEGFGGDSCEQAAASSAGCNPNNPEVNVISTIEECVESPNYPAGYTSGDFCNWYFLAPEGQTIDLTFRGQFDVFVMPPHQVCHHWVEVRTKTGLNTRGPRFCSSSRPSDTFTSESNEAVVSFNSQHPTSAQQNTGFRLCYKQ